MRLIDIWLPHAVSHITVVWSANRMWEALWWGDLHDTLHWYLQAVVFFGMLPGPGEPGSQAGGQPL